MIKKARITLYPFMFHKMDNTSLPAGLIHCLRVNRHRRILARLGYPTRKWTIFYSLHSPDSPIHSCTHEGLSALLLTNKLFTCRPTTIWITSWKCTCIPLSIADQLFLLNNWALLHTERCTWRGIRNNTLAHYLKKFIYFLASEDSIYHFTSRGFKYNSTLKHRHTLCVDTKSIWSPTFQSGSSWHLSWYTLIVSFGIILQSFFLFSQTKICSTLSHFPSHLLTECRSTRCH